MCFSNCLHFTNACIPVDELKLCEVSSSGEMSEAENKRSRKRKKYGSDFEMQGNVQCELYNPLLQNVNIFC